LILGAGYSRLVLAGALGHGSAHRTPGEGKQRYSYHWQCGCIAQGASDEDLTVYACSSDAPKLVGLSSSKPFVQGELSRIGRSTLPGLRLLNPL
jgi:hypothetical protein